MDLYNSIILKDIIQRNNIQNVDLLDRIMRFVMYNIGQTFSANKIYKRLKQDMVNLSVNTIYNYLKFFENACLIHQVKREDLQGKKILKYDEKYYLSDLGFRQSILGNNQRDITRVIENIDKNKTSSKNSIIHIWGTILFKNSFNRFLKNHFQALLKIVSLPITLIGL